MDPFHSLCIAIAYELYLSKTKPHLFKLEHTANVTKDREREQVSKRAVKTDLS